MERLKNHGRALAREAGGLDPSNGGDCLWALTIEAAATLASLPSVGPKGYPSQSSMPEGRTPLAERFGIEREWQTEGIKYGLRVRHAPSPIAVELCDAVWDLWRVEALKNLKIVQNPRRTRDILWLYAGGLKPRDIRRRFDVGRSTLHSWRRRCSDRLAVQLYGLEQL